MLLNHITFNNPYILLIFPLLAGILIYIYVNFYSNKKIYFPSFFLLEKSNENIKKGKKLKLPIRFFYELLILFLFTLLFSGISKNNNQQKYLIYIDNSFSTKSKISRYHTRFDEIKDQAISYIKKLPINSQITIKTSDGMIDSVYQTPNSAINLIKEIENSFTQDNLDNYIFNTNDYNHSFIFTDKNLYSNDEKIQPISITQSQNICNFSITNLYILEETIYANISSFCNSPELLNISLSCNNTKIPTKKIQVLPKENVIENIKLPSNIVYNNKYSLCKITISSKNDILKEDNEAFFVYNKQKNNIYLISDNKFNKNDFIHLPFDIINLSSTQTQKIKKEDTIILYNQNIKELPNYNALIINPTQNSIFYNYQTNKYMPVTYFLNGHQLISYINPINIKFKKYISLKNTDTYYLKNILAINSSPILATLEHNNNKYIISGFSFLPFKSTSLENKILFLNSIKYLNTNYLNKNFKTLPYSYKNKLDNKIVSIKSSGFFRINNTHEAFNFFNQSESNIINNNEYLTINITNTQIKKTANAKINKLYDWITILITILILLEFVYFMFKKTELKNDKNNF